jgi:hypothetical protein
MMKHKILIKEVLEAKGLNQCQGCGKFHEVTDEMEKDGNLLCECGDYDNEYKKH